MPAYVSFLRGINVGGHNRVKMADLRDLYEQLGFYDVSSYIQTGNVVFESDADRESARDSIVAGIADELGFDIDVVVLTADDLDDVRDASPFVSEAEEDPKKVYVFFFERAVDSELVAEVLDDYDGPERASCGRRVLYAYFPDGMGRSKFPIAKIESRLGCRSTARNWNTLTKVCAMTV